MLNLNSFNLGDRIEEMKKIKSNSIDFIFTSPPYNVGKPYKNHNDLMNYKDYLKFLYDTWKETKRILKIGGRIAINVPSVTAEGSYQSLFVDVVNQMKELGFIMRCDIVWHKDHISKRTAWGSWMSPSNPYVVQPYEFILVFSKDDKKHYGDKEKSDITRDEFIKYTNAMWNILPETKLSKNHPAPFPEELVYRLIKFYTFKEDIVLDMFGGSGSVPYVCLKNNRNFIYIDNCKEYMNFAKKRCNEVTNNILNFINTKPKEQVLIK